MAKTKKKKTPKSKSSPLKLCTRKGCDAPMFAKELCQRHYQTEWRWKTGRTESMRKQTGSPRLALCPRVNERCYELLAEAGDGHPNVGARVVLERWAQRQSAA